MNYWVCGVFCVWIIFGILGYIMMRQGFLVRFERKGYGKDEVWGVMERVVGVLFYVMGPFGPIISLCVVGRDAFRKRPNKDIV